MKIDELVQSDEKFTIYHPEDFDVAKHALGSKSSDALEYYKTCCETKICYKHDSSNRHDNKTRRSNNKKQATPK